jgi:hypothetical protein
MSRIRRSLAGALDVEGVINVRVRQSLPKKRRFHCVPGESSRLSAASNAGRL